MMEPVEPIILQSNILKYQEELDQASIDAGIYPGGHCEEGVLRLAEACHYGAGVKLVVSPASLELHCNHCGKLVMAAAVLFKDGEPEKLKALLPPFDGMYQTGHLNVRDRKTGTIIAIEVEKRRNE